MFNNYWVSYYSIADTTKPEAVQFTAGEQSGRDYAMVSERANFASACSLQSPRPPYTTCPSFGDMITEINDWLPLQPISAPWTTSIAAYNYTANSLLPNGRFEQRQDLDLHNGNRGILVSAGNNDVQGFANRQVTFDPAAMGSGTHKEALFWTQTFAATGEVASTLVVFDVAVGGSVPPVVDVCPNIDGVQVTVPPGFQIVNGQCVPITPVDPFSFFTPFWRKHATDPTLVQICTSQDPKTCVGVVIK